MSERPRPPHHYNPPPMFGLRLELEPNVAIYRGGEFIAYHHIDPKSPTGRVIFRPMYWPSESDLIVHANDATPTPPAT